MRRLIERCRELLRNVHLWAAVKQKWASLQNKSLLASLNPIVAALTLIVTVAAFYVVLRQLDLMEEQLRIMQKQEEFIMAQLSRRPELTLRIVAKAPDQQNTNTQLEFVVENTGNKTARDFYWHLLIPTQLSRQDFNTPAIGFFGPEQEVRIGSVEYRRFSSVFKDYFSPTRKMRLGSIALDNPIVKGHFEVHWKIVAEDGVFPPEEVGRVVLNF